MPVGRRKTQNKVYWRFLIKYKSDEPEKTGEIASDLAAVFLQQSYLVLNG